MRFNKDFLVIFMGKVVQIFIMVGTIKVSTMLLSPKEMGNIYLFLTIQTFFVFTFISPIGQYINRQTHNWNKNKSIVDNLTLFFVYVIIVSIFSIFIGYVLYIFFGIGNDFEVQTFLLLLFGFILLVTLNQTYVPMLNMLYFRIEFTILTVLTSLGILIFGYFLVSVFSPKAEVWLGAILLSNFIMAVYGYSFLKKKTNNVFTGSLKLLNKIKTYNFQALSVILIPIAIATLFMWLQNSGYRVIIEQKISLEFLGYLGVGLAVSYQLASVFESILTQYLSPIYYQKISNQLELENRIQSFEWLVNIKLPMYFSLAFYVTIFAPYIVDILVDERYKNVYIFSIFGIWIEFLRILTNTFYIIALSELKTKKIMFPYILGSLVTVLFVYVSSENINYEIYLPIGLLIGGFITMILMYFSMKKLINFKIEYRLVILSFILAFPYSIIYLLNLESSLYNSFFVVLVSGLYFMGIILFIYKQGFKNGYS